LAGRSKSKIAPVGSAADGRLALSGNLSLAKGEVHVWFVRLQGMSRHIDSLLEILDPDEVARAARFLFESDRNEYILARGLLRHIVGCYAGFAPHLLQFCYNSHGKPALPSEWGGDQLAFNLSHSRGVAVYAVTRARHVGVDLEYMHEDAEFDQIAECFFSPREASLFRRLPSDKKREAFFSCWTRKEAYTKARGEGLSMDLRSFDVTFAPGQPASILSVTGDSSEAQRWSLADLPAPGGYAAALVVEGIVSRIQHWQWTV
jgi:4'-phosphopantetheinyl transferase